MVDLFVYDWFYTGYTVYGHCLDESGKYALLTVRNFQPSCYVESERVARSSIIPVKCTIRQMATSRDISHCVNFDQLFFSNSAQMKSFVSDVRTGHYMSDVPQTSVFLSQVKADHVGWVRVRSLDVDCAQVEPIPNKIPYSSPKVLSFDIEVKSSSAGMPKAYRLGDTVEMISVVLYNTSDTTNTKQYVLHAYDFDMCVPGATCVSCNGEMELIVAFFNVIEREDPTIITGFNIFGFDFAYLISRLQLRLHEIPDVSRGLKGNVSLIKVDWSSDAYGHNRYDRLVIGGRLILDMFLYFRRMKLEKYSLDFISNKFLGEGKNSMPYATMAGAFASKDENALTEVAKYCLQDSMLVIKLFDEVQMWIDVCEISKITRCAIEDIYTRGEQMKLVSQCVNECMKRNVVLMPQPIAEWRQYEGAYVLEPRKGVYDRCTMLDFQSLYPSIIIAFNVCPSTYARAPATQSILSSMSKDHFIIDDVDVPDVHCFRKEPVGLLPGMVKSLLDERKAVKTAMKSCDKSSITYVVLNRRQNALKVCANSIYGMMGFKNSRYFGHLGCAESVTAVGRNYLSKIVEDIEKDYPVNVVYGDTDSCVLWYSQGEKNEIIKSSLKICDEVTAKLPSPMALVFEAYYDKVVLLTKKRYIMVAGETISYKGVMNARRDYCKYAKEMYKEVVAMIATSRSREDIADFVDGRLIRLLSGKCDVSDLVITKSIAREIGSYKVNQPHVVMARRLVEEKGIDISAGTRLEYLFVKEFDTQAEKMRTPEEVELENLNVDGAFYIKKQLVTQIDDVLSVIGLENYIKNSWIF